jgi:hypothetical protein
MVRPLLLLLVVLVLAGCGGGKTNPALGVDTSLAQLELAGNIAAESKDGSGDLPTATRNFISFVENNRKSLGKDRAARLLSKAASDVQPWCWSCAAMLDRERNSL